MNIITRSLCKRYGSVTALDNVDLDVRKGEIFGLFGPNGAGKTTWIRVVTGMVEPSRGQATVCGVDVIKNPVAVRENVSILVELPFLYEKMTLGNYLNFYADLALMDRKVSSERIWQVLRMMEMEGMWDKKLRTMSMGQRQRCEIARVLMSDAQVIFLDEPFNGIDIQIRKKIREYFRVWLSEGRSIVFTSHNLLESEHIVDRFAFIKNGKITAIGTAQDLKKKFLRPVFFVETPNPDELRAALSGVGFITLVNSVPGGLQLGLTRREDVLELQRIFVSKGLMVFEIRALGTIEDVFDTLNTSAWSFVPQFPNPFQPMPGFPGVSQQGGFPNQAMPGQGLVPVQGNQPGGEKQR